MAMKITLMKDHETPEGSFKKGEVIEVTEDVYDWLMEVYKAERIADSEFLQDFGKKVKQLGKKK